jgi:hypothetical protein
MRNGKIKFYVAGPADEIDVARSLIRVIEEAGHEITFNWTHLKKDGGQGVIRPTWQGYEEEARIHAEKERNGVRFCSILVFWLPTRAVAGKGCYWEAGMASADPMKDVWLLNYDGHMSDLVFYYLDNVEIISVREFSERLARLKV